jgi:uncharacterized protein (UPF0218 family)
MLKLATVVDQQLVEIEKTQNELLLPLRWCQIIDAMHSRRETNKQKSESHRKQPVLATNGKPTKIKSPIIFAMKTSVSKFELFVIQI